MFWKTPNSPHPAPSHQEQRCLNQVKRLTQALIVSGTVNILLLAFVLYGLFGNGMLLFRDSLKPRPGREAVMHSGKTLGQVLQSYQTLPWEQLIAKLEETSWVQGGYAERDLALGYLVWRHHFDLNRALVDAPPTAQRHIPIRSGQQTSQLTLFPHLTARQYAAIVQFAKTERWPLTTRGIYYELKRQPEEPSLVEAFYLTPEFLTLQRAFARADIEVSKGDLRDLALKGSWSTFQAALASLPEAKAALIAQSAPQPAPVECPRAPAEVPAKVHVVKQGDSLWKIAKNYQVDLAKLKAHNHLCSDVLRPGASLHIP